MAQALSEEEFERMQVRLAGGGAKKKNKKHERCRRGTCEASSEQGDGSGERDAPWRSGLRFREAFPAESVARGRGGGGLQRREEGARCP